MIGVYSVQYLYRLCLPPEPLQRPFIVPKETLRLLQNLFMIIIQPVLFLLRQ